MLVADCNQLVDKSVLAEKVTRRLTNQAGMVHATPRRKTTCTAARFGKLARQVLQTAVQHQVHVYWILQVRNQHVFLWQRLEISRQLPATMRAAATSLQHVPVAFQFVRRPFPRSTTWRLVRYQMRPVLV